MKVQQLKEEIKKLSREELTELQDWLLELDWERWDQQIERDAAEGKLDKLFSVALADHLAANSKKL